MSSSPEFLPAGGPGGVTVYRDAVVFAGERARHAAVVAACVVAVACVGALAYAALARALELAGGGGGCCFPPTWRPASRSRGAVAAELSAAGFALRAPAAAARKTIVVFVRHCESHSNVADDEFGILWREALCTCRGVAQSYAAGGAIESYVSERWPDRKVAIYCSALPRAMQTAQDMSVRFPKSRLARDTIERVKFAVERCAPAEATGASAARYGTANTTTVAASNAHARALNARVFKGKLPIDVSAAATSALAESAFGGGGGAGGGGARIAYSAGDFGRFVSHVVPTFDPDAVNLVVGHGWWIWKHLIADGCGVARAAKPPRVAEEVATADVLDNLGAVVAEFGGGGGGSSSRSAAAAAVPAAMLVGHIPAPLAPGVPGLIPDTAPASIRRFFSASATASGAYDDNAIVDSFATAGDLAHVGKRALPGALLCPGTAFADD